MDIVINKGLDIPFHSKAGTSIETCQVSKAALTFDTFLTPKGIKLLVKVGDNVALGQPLAQDKDGSERLFVSPISGSVCEIRRGARRSLEAIVVAAEPLPALKHRPLSPAKITREDLVSEMLQRGLFAHIRQRPFNKLADPHKKPKSIFIKALESAPLGFHPEEQVQSHAEAFQNGLDFLKLLTDGSLHLVHEVQTCKAISQAKQVVHHTISGPHPRSLPSVHIHHIDPIQTPSDIVWTLTAWDVLVIGYTLTQGIYFNQRLVAVGGPGFVEAKRTHIQTVTGAYIGELVFDRLSHAKEGEKRIISGDPLTGKAVGLDDFLHFSHSSLVALTESSSREFLHFFRPGFHKYTASGAYLSHWMPAAAHFQFNTQLHGEPRAFIDGEIYERVMPMRIPTIHLVKAAIADDLESCMELGLLEVDGEDFALATFVCPSKVEMVEIMKEAIIRFGEQLS
jgi:Na+-transporting NADH:ubiquinone oxidoreductase subunit A